MVPIQTVLICDFFHLLIRLSVLSTTSFIPQVALTRATKASILKNDEKIQLMLSGMTLSGQS